MSESKRRSSNIELAPSFLPEGKQPPARVSGNRQKYESLLTSLKKRKGEWAELATLPKGHNAGPLYARRSTIAKFEGYTAQVRQLGADHKSAPMGTGLFAMFGSLPKAAKAVKAAKE